ncbi:MAG TPA: hypothetical protein VEB19_07915 [Gemmatimonadaceae bacterium]|nr:hypothetical protein [Gemmatimonadaceae bacterium]
MVATPTAGLAPSPVRSTDGFGNALPWAVAAIAILALIALAAGQRFARTTTQGMPAANAPGSRLGSPTRAPDISSMTPLERAERLYDRIMGAADRGRADSARFFLPMAVQSYEALGPLTVDQRYDLGRLGEVAGDATLAAAQSDTILQQQPQHLLGLVLRYRVARARGDAPAASRALDQLNRAAPAELRKQLPEYLVRQVDIDSALAAARRR